MNWKLKYLLMRQIADVEISVDVDSGDISLINEEISDINLDIIYNVILAHTYISKNGCVRSFSASAYCLDEAINGLWDIVSTQTLKIIDGDDRYIKWNGKQFEKVEYE